jgi:hypothetical protein
VTNEIVYAIPSYCRARTLTAKTLPLLRDRGVPMGDVSVFVEPHQVDEYAETVEPFGVSVVSAPPHGVGQVHNFIARHYPVGTRVVSVDDDVSDLVRRVNDKTVEPLSDVHVFAHEMFALADSIDAYLWGIYPAMNPMFMAPRRTFGLTYMTCLWGQTLRGLPCEIVTLDHGEDYERSIQFCLQDGGVLRADDVAPKTKYRTEPGGMQEYREPGCDRAACEYLVEKYPDLCRIKVKKSGAVDLAFTRGFITIAGRGRPRPLPRARRANRPK